MPLEISLAKRPPLIADVASAVLLAAISVALWLYSPILGQLNASHPYLMGFCNFAVLSTYGEALNHRIAAGSWWPPKLLARALVWGVFGIWITAAFPYAAGGVGALVEGGLWPSYAMAFWTSLWANLLSGFGFFMMATHLWVSSMVEDGPRWPWEVFGSAQAVGWARVVLISLVFFWLPAHTLTFLLPAEWRTLFASYLGIALGLLLSLASRRSRPSVLS